MGRIANVATSEGSSASDGASTARSMAATGSDLQREERERRHPGAPHRAESNSNTREVLRTEDLHTAKCRRFMNVRF